MPWGVAAAAVGAAGSIIGGQEQQSAAQTAANSANSPWSAAQPYIQQEFQPAQDALNTSLGRGAYTGQRTASLNPYQTQGANQTAGYVNQFGNQIPGQLYGAGMGALSNGANFASNAQGLYQGAQADPTQQFLGTASQYANNPYANQMIDSANLDVSRDLNETQLPSLALNAAGAGNTNSTRTGVESAVLQRNAAQQMANTAANIRGTLFNNGLSMAQGQYNQNFSNALNANQQLSGQTALGLNAMNGSQTAAGNNFDQMNAAGGLYQTQNQNELNAAQQQWADQNNVPMDLIGKYMSVINGSWGGQPVGVPNNTVSNGIQGALGGAALGTGLSQKLGGSFGWGSNPTQAQTAAAYGTNEGSQQTAMLNAQDAGMWG